MFIKRKPAFADHEVLCVARWGPIDLAAQFLHQIAQFFVRQRGEPAR
jgi:hypothetical protein